jgi:hypothetical protein
MLKYNYFFKQIKLLNSEYKIQFIILKNLFKYKNGHRQ